MRTFRTVEIFLHDIVFECPDVQKKVEEEGIVTLNEAKKIFLESEQYKSLWITDYLAREVLDRLLHDENECYEHYTAWICGDQYKLYHGYRSSRR